MIFDPSLTFLPRIFFGNPGTTGWRWRLRLGFHNLNIAHGGNLSSSVDECYWKNLPEEGEALYEAACDDVVRYGPAFFDWLVQNRDSMPDSFRRAFDAAMVEENAYGL